MAARLAPCPDALLQRRGDRWMFSNPRTRTHVALDAAAVAAVAGAGAGTSEEGWARSLGGASGWDATEEFFGERGLHADHSGRSEENTAPRQGSELFALLRKRRLLVEEGGRDYAEHFHPLTSILDRDHLGTFHQRVGQFLTVKKRLREERWRWWHDQKFAPDGLSIREGPYKNAQESFVRSYFTAEALRDRRVLDFGCGNGYFGAFFAGLGAKVTGIDTSPELLEAARSAHGAKAEFLRHESLAAEVAWLKHFSAEFDLVFMQDILLLLLRPESGPVPDELDALLRAFHRALKPSGSVCMMEPDPVFWLAGRYGDPSRPYAVVTEYRRPVFNVVPLLGEVVGKMSEAGFGLTEFAHPEYRSDDARLASEKAYANEFAVWDFMRFNPFP